ncbi:MAG TPA: Trp biosynthesis-associated membrane protein [Streptosporangiaceae bacterium]
MPDTRREYGVVLVLGAAGGALILIALREVWAHAIYTPPHPIPAQDYAVTGQSLIPLASALAVAALACLAAVIATRGLARRVVGALLAVIGGYAAVTVTAAVTAAAVLTTAQNANPATGSGTGGGSTTSGVSGGGSGGVLVSGAPGHAVMTGLGWHVVAAIGALAIALAGLATLCRGPRWPVMSARFERPDRRSATARPKSDSATMWESLSRDVDPTAGADGADTDLDVVDLGSGGDPGRP